MAFSRFSGFLFFFLEGGGQQNWVCSSYNRGVTGGGLNLILWQIQFVKTVFSDLICAENESEDRFGLSLTKNLN